MFFAPESLTCLGMGHPVASIPHHSPISPQTYVVKVKRESPSEVTFVQRTFEEFQELHNKLRLLFPSSLLPRYSQTWQWGFQCPAGSLNACALCQLPQQVHYWPVTRRGSG